VCPRAGTLAAGHAMLQAGRLTSAQLVTFVFYLNFVLGAVYDVGDQVSNPALAIL
jgi:hypothetical protein